MAKVYDALKQVELERSRQLRVAAEQESGGESPDSTLWRRMSGRLGGRNGAAEEIVVPVISERVVRERMDAMLARFEALERRSADGLPELERNVAQHIERRIASVEREMSAAVATLSNQIRQEAANLNRRVSLLFGAAAMILAVLLLRH